MLERKNIKINDPEVSAVLSKLDKRDDFKSLRIKKLLAFPDLTRIENSPLKFLVDAILAIPRFQNFDVIEVPEIVSVKNNFDLLNTPADHPSRRETDTYYLEPDWVLRTHTTVMWPFYLSSENKAKLETEGEIGVLCYGKCYRKDEIDRSHYPVFHQIDGLYLSRKDNPIRNPARANAPEGSSGRPISNGAGKVIGTPELQEVLIDVAKKIYGEEIQYEFGEDTFPFTYPSLEMLIKWGEGWLEILGAGVVHAQVLKNLGIDPDVYNGWAFGTGLERLAMIKMNIPDIRIFWSKDSRIISQFKSLESSFTEVSKYPMSYRDISFVVEKTSNLNNYYEIVRDSAGDLVEEVKLFDKYENTEKFGADKISYTFRIIYRSHERTLTNEEVDKIQNSIEERTKEEFKAVVR